MPRVRLSRRYLELGIIGGITYVAAAGEAVGDCMQGSRCEQFGSVINQWWVDILFVYQ